MQHDCITAWKLQLRLASLLKWSRGTACPRGQRKGTESNCLLSEGEGPGSCAWRQASWSPGSRAGSLQMLQCLGCSTCVPVARAGVEKEPSTTPSVLAPGLSTWL